MHIRPAGDIRDHLANERTFLAYIRTSLAFIGFGFVVARFAVVVREIAEQQMRAKVPPPGASLGFGTAMVFAGVAIALFGLTRFAAARRAIAEGRADALSARAALAIVAVLCAFGAVAAYGLYAVPHF